MTSHNSAVKTPVVLPKLDMTFVRSQFPALNDPPVAFFENAGGSFVCQQVTAAYEHYLRLTRVQPYAAYTPSHEAGEAMDRSYHRLASLINADPDEVMLGPSTSMNTYILAQALREQLAQGDEVIVTNQDHEANIGTWRRLAHAGIIVKVWEVDEEGRLDIEQLTPLITERTRWLCFTHCSNIVAQINDVQKITQIAHDASVKVVVDGVSFSPHGIVDVKALGADVYLYSLYKTYGPHLGLMYVKREVLEALPHQGHFFNEDRVTPQISPRYRLTPAGPHHADIAVAGAVVDYYDALLAHHLEGAVQLSSPERAAYLSQLFNKREEAAATPIIDALKAIPHVRIIGPATADHNVRGPTIAFVSGKTSSAEIAQALQARGIGTNNGHFYAYRLLASLGIEPEDGVVRLSLVHYTSDEEVARVVQALDEIF